MAPTDQERDRHTSLSSNNSAVGLLARRGKPYQQHRRLQSGGSSVPSTVSPVLSSPPWRQPPLPAHPRSQNQNRLRDQEPYYEEESWEKRAPGAAAAPGGGAVGAGTVTTTISSPLSPRRPAPVVPAGVGVAVGGESGAGTGAGVGAAGPGGDQSSGFEFRGFDFFAKKDFNELRDASRAYFNNLNVGRPSSFISFGGASGSAAKRSSTKGAAAGNGGSDGNGASWLGDATPPPSPTLEPKRAVGAVPPLSGDGGGLDSDEKAKGRGARAVGAAGAGAGAAAGVGAAAGGGRGAADGDGGEGGGLADGMFPEEPDESEPRIFGIRKRMFWVLVALLCAVLLVIIIAVSVGVSMGKKNSGNDSDLSAVTPTASSSPQIGTSGATTVTATETTPASTVTTTATKEEDMKHSSTPTPKPMPGGSAQVDCPAANGTTYQVPGSDKKFLRICGVDYTGSGSRKEATDIGQVQTETMLDCMKNCAGTSGCDACAWGYLDGDQGTLHRCWMKSNLAQSGGHEVDEDWSFAILV